MAEQFANNASSTLSVGMDGSTTTASLASGTLFPATGTYRVRIDDEIMRVTARASNDLTVVRGTEGTSAASHSAGAAVTCVVTAAALSQFATDILASVSLTAAALAALGVIGLKPGTDLTDADASLQAATANLYTMPAAVQTTTRTLTLSAPSDTSKPWVICIVNRGSQALNITNGGGAADSLTPVAAGCAATFVWDAPGAGENGTDWHNGAYWTLPP